MTGKMTRETLNAFLADKERRALSMAEFAVGNRDDALDIVQDAMIRFTTRYSNKPEPEWAPLFHRVLQSRIQDFFRKVSVKNKYFAWLPGLDRYGDDDQDNSIDPIQQFGDNDAISQERLFESALNAEKINHAVRQLPIRQQQAFLLRCWEGLDTRMTAKAMQCSEGSVKTHYSRALNQLKKSLQSTYNEYSGSEDVSDMAVSENTHESKTA